MTLKGAILCGGTGTRLRPLTEVVNKHLVGVAGLPMVEYPLRTLLCLGIRDICIVTGGEHVGAFTEYLGSGLKWNCRFTYRVQDGPGGIAQAVLCTEGFLSHGDRLAVILGDNLFSNAPIIKNFDAGAQVVLTDVPDPRRFGVAWFMDDAIGGLIEKPRDINGFPKSPRQPMAITGLYVYTPDVYDVIRTLKPSARGELEITDANAVYLERAMLYYSIHTGFWSDMGTPESLRASEEYLWAHPGILEDVRMLWRKSKP